MWSYLNDTCWRKEDPLLVTLSAAETSGESAAGQFIPGGCI
jgi:hypothetical protein